MSDSLPEPVDVVVVGSGAAGLLASIRAHDLGLKAIVIEKSDHYGGTSAISGGGIWVPNNFEIEGEDNAELALTYLRACTEGTIPDGRLKAYIADAPRMARYLHQNAGVPLVSIRPFPDYRSRLPGAINGRAMAPADFDGATLGEDYFRLREPYSYLRLFGRLSINNFEAGLISAKASGWQKLMGQLLWRYWRDLSWRTRTKRDRRLCNGQALVGRLRKAMKDRGIPLFLKTGLVRLLRDSNGRVSGLKAERNGKFLEISAARGVILAAGGFESNQPMRERFRTPSSAPYSGTPHGLNTGDAIRAGLEIGAKLEFADLTWRAPVLRMPVLSESNVEFALPFFWERNAPGSICVNRLGRRFVDEGVSYDEFGAAMLSDHQKTGANLPCWMIFDAGCRTRAFVGPLLPGEIKPDRKLPPEWLDSVYYRAESLSALANKIDIDAGALEHTVSRFNVAAAAGRDPEFDRGGSAYDRFWAHPKLGCLQPLQTPPFYAIRLDLGDLGTKGGLAIDTASRVLGEGGVIPGLCAAGNCSGSIFGNAYPGAGGTLGPALTMAMVAAETLAASP